MLLSWSGVLPGEAVQARLLDGDRTRRAEMNYPSQGSRHARELNKAKNKTLTRKPTLLLSETREITYLSSSQISKLHNYEVNKWLFFNSIGF